MRPVVLGGWSGCLARRCVCTALLALSLVVPACVATPRLGGPLPVRNQHPAQLLVMHLDPADAAVLPAGRSRLRSNFAYSSLFLLGSAASHSFRMDGELLRSSLSAGIGLGGGLQLGAELATAHTSGGFLDSFLIDYHELFGFPDQGREDYARNDWSVEARRNGQVAWSMERDGFELLDLPLSLTWQLREPGVDRLGLAVRGGVELPTGDEDRGYGNGELDTSIGGLWDYRTAGVGFSGHLQHTFAGTPDRAREYDLEFRDVTSAGAAVELPLADGLHALVQVEWESSTLRALGPKATARDQLLLWVGGRWIPDPAWAVEVAFGEDLAGLVSPDFTAWLAVQWTPGG